MASFVRASFSFNRSGSQPRAASLTQTQQPSSAQAPASPRQPSAYTFGNYAVQPVDNQPAVSSSSSPPSGMYRAATPPSRGLDPIQEQMHGVGHGHVSAPNPNVTPGFTPSLNGSKYFERGQAVLLAPVFDREGETSPEPEPQPTWVPEAPTTPKQHTSKILERQDKLELLCDELETRQVAADRALLGSMAENVCAISSASILTRTSLNAQTDTALPTTATLDGAAAAASG